MPRSGPSNLWWKNTLAVAIASLSGWVYGPLFEPLLLRADDPAGSSRVSDSAIIRLIDGFHSHNPQSSPAGHLFPRIGLQQVDLQQFDQRQPNQQPTPETAPEFPSQPVATPASPRPVAPPAAPAGSTPDMPATPRRDSEPLLTNSPSSADRAASSTDFSSEPGEQSPSEVIPAAGPHPGEWEPQARPVDPPVLLISHPTPVVARGPRLFEAGRASGTPLPYVPAPLPMNDPAPIPFAPAAIPDPLPEYREEAPIPFQSLPLETEVAEPLFGSTLGLDDPYEEYTGVTECFDPAQLWVEELPAHGKPVPKCCDPCSPWYKIFRPFCSQPVNDRGIGHERVMFAPFHIETAQPQNFTGLRFDNAFGLQTPDRAELFWARQGIGPPLNETTVDYSDVVLTLSSGNTSFATITEIPIRYINPTFNDNTSGLGDISIATKLVMLDGDHWTFTQYFRTVMPTGSKSRGLGTGHVSLEPGFLAQMKWTERTWLFGELRYLFAIGGDRNHVGQRLQYGLGMSTILYETDEFAILPTLEMTGFSVPHGSKTLPNGVIVDAGGESTAISSVGVRLVLGPAGDLGLFELGFSHGAATNDFGMFQHLTRFDMRFVY